MCCCQRYCTWKRFSSSLQQITLVFTSFYSKQPFYLCLGKWRCFRILFLRTTFTSVFVTKLHFWCSILLEKCFSFFVTKLNYLWAVYYIKPAFACWQENRAALSFISQKKSVFAFFVAKTRKTQLYSTKNMFWFLCCNIGLFSVFLHRKMVFFQYAGGHPDFHLILLKQRFSFLLARWRCLRIVFLRTNLFSVSITKLHFGRSILPKKCFGLLAT